MGDNDAMSKAIELEQNERWECRGTYGNNGCGWNGTREGLNIGCCPSCGGGHIHKRYDGMVVDMRGHAHIREQVRAGLGALLVQGRQIWGPARHSTSEIVLRLMVGVGDLARLTRDAYVGPLNGNDHERWRLEIRKEFGNIIFSTVRWIDDLGLDVLECLDLAIATQEKFAASGRPR